MSPRTKRPTRTYAALLTVGLCTGVAAALATLDANAQGPAQSAAAPAPQASAPAAVSPTATSGVTLESIGVSLTNLLAGIGPSATEVPLTSTLQPTTPWPASSNISQTLLTTSHDLLAYVGIDTSARKMLGADYATWHAQFNNKAEGKALPQGGLLMATGCLQPEIKAKCNVQKSLLIADPSSQKIYAAMVTEGKVAMWPSLMSWPDEAVPSLKDWLADATDGE